MFTYIFEKLFILANYEEKEINKRKLKITAIYVILRKKFTRNVLVVLN